MSENRIRLFGELMQNPAPLELSLNECSYDCLYCFAKLNGRELREVDAHGTLSWLRRVMGGGYNPDNFAEHLLYERHPIVFSNAVDPLSFRNLESTRQILPTLRKIGIPVVFQTRGTRQVEQFREFVELLPRDSVLYMSITTFRADVLRQVERGCPSNEQRLEMMHLAAELRPDVRRVAALNPAVPEWMGDPYEYVAQCVERSAGSIQGAWIEPLHLSKRQYKAALAKTKGQLPVLAEPVFCQAADEDAELDPVFFRTLFDAVRDAGWRSYSMAFPDGQASLFELWPRPFGTHHAAIAECERLSQETGKTVIVTFDAWASWCELPEIALSRGDAWAIINLRQNAGQDERKALPPRLTLREVLRILWNRPDMAHAAVWGDGLGVMAFDVGEEVLLSRDPETGDFLAGYDSRRRGFGLLREAEVDGMVLLPLKGRAMHEPLMEER